MWLYTAFVDYTNYKINVSTSILSFSEETDNASSLGVEADFPEA